MWWRTPHNPTPYDDDWEDQPSQGWFYQYVLGIALPLGLIAFGTYAVAMQHVSFGGSNPMKLNGWNAISFGIAWIAAGVFVHCHYFWGNVFDQAWFAVLGKIASAICFIAGLGFVIVRNVVFGIR
jgi:hypothetical protein